MRAWLDSLKETMIGRQDYLDIFWLQIFIVLFMTLLASYFAHVTLKKLEAKFARTKTLWDDAVAHAAGKPLVAAIWVLGTSFAITLVHDYTKAEIFSMIYPLRDVGVVGCITWFFFRAIQGIEKNYVEERKEGGKHVDYTTLDAIGKIARIAVVMTSGLIVMQALGFSISGILAFGGVGGVVAGLSAKDMLANFFGAMMVYLGRPFAVGDWIRSPDRDIEGVVEKIGWRQTIIRTFDKRPLYVPNSAFATITVENPSRMTHRRIHEYVGVRYDDIKKVQAIVEDVEKMVKKHKGIDDKQVLIVNVDRFGPSSVDFFIYALTKTIDWVEYHGVKQDVLLKTAKIITKHGAEIAFPTTTVHVADQIQVRPEFQGLKEIFKPQATKGKAKKKAA